MTKRSGYRVIPTTLWDSTVLMLVRKSWPLSWVLFQSIWSQSPCSMPLLCVTKWGWKWDQALNSAGLVLTSLKVWWNTMYYCKGPLNLVAQSLVTKGSDLTSSARQTVQPCSIPDPNCFLCVLCVWIFVLGPWFLMFLIMTVPPPNPSIPRSLEVSTSIPLRIQAQLAAAK